MKSVKFLLLFLVVALASPAGTVFFEGFDENGAPIDDDTNGGSRIGNTQFYLSSGSIDLVGGSYYSQLCSAPASGYCIDTTGAGNQRGVIYAPITLGPGNYVLSFDLEAWYTTDITDANAVVQVDFGGVGGLIVPQSIQVVGGNTYAPISIPFTVASTVTDYLTFTDQGGTYPFAGAILDNVEIDTSSVPEPGSVVLFGVGALILLASKRARR